MRYGYEKRIRELEQQIRTLEPYRRIALDIYDASINVLNEKGTSVSIPWIIRQYRQIFP
jgi:hypothetical protein